MSVTGRGSARPAARQVDIDTAAWIASLAPDAADRDAAVGRLHALLLRATRVELSRRAFRTHIAGKEVDDLAHQAADDALVAILRRLCEFRGDSRFTTWAYKFAILEVSSKLGRHFWSRPDLSLARQQWEQLPSRFAPSPESAAEAGELFAAVRTAVDTVLTVRQRQIFLALVVDGIPLDALAAKLATNRNAIYKVMFDARRKIRVALVTNGYLDDHREAGR